MHTRRKFLQKLTAFTAAANLPFYNTLEGKNLLRNIQEKEHLSPSEIAEDEDFWHLVREKDARFSKSQNLSIAVFKLSCTVIFGFHLRLQEEKIQ